MTVSILIHGLVTGILIIWGLITAAAVFGFCVAGVIRFVDRWQHHG